MLALNETAALYVLKGMNGGRPEYAREGADFACRTQPCEGRRADGRGLAASGRVRVFAPPMAVKPGDRLETGGRTLTVREVKALRGLREIHHLELIAEED